MAFFYRCSLRTGWHWVWGTCTMRLRWRETMAVLCFPALVLAQDDVPPVRVESWLTGLLHGAYANVPAKKEFPDENSVIERTRRDNTKKVRMGFELGTQLSFFPGENFKGFLGLSLARSTMAHHYSYISDDPTNKPGYTHVKRSTQEDIDETYFALGYHAGFRRKIVSSFFLSPSFVLHQPLRINRITNGYTETLPGIGDLEGYRKDFYNLFGFRVNGVNYAQDVNEVVNVPGLVN